MWKRRMTNWFRQLRSIMMSLISFGFKPSYEKLYHLVIAAIYMPMKKRNVLKCKKTCRNSTENYIYEGLLMVKCAQNGQDFRSLPSDACEPSRDQICKFWVTNTLRKFYRMIPGNNMGQITRVRTALIFIVSFGMVMQILYFPCSWLSMGER